MPYNQTIVIDGTITLLAPFSASQPDGDDNFNKFPLMPRGIGADGKPSWTGYIPAGAMRGKLRRAAVMPRLLADAENGSPWALADVYERLIGQNAASEAKMEEETIDLAAIAQRREAEPVLDLFGSGLGLKSRLLVSHFLPEENIMPVKLSGVRTDLDATDGAVENLPEADRQRFYQREASNRIRSQSEKAIKDIDRQIRLQEQGRAAKALSAEEIAGLKREREVLVERERTAREAMGGMEVSSLMPHAYFALPAGLKLSGRLVVDQPKERDVALLTNALDMMSRRPLLGAHVARGAGEFSASFDFRREGAIFRRVTIGGYAPAQVVDLSAEAA
jgi:hypothetical protein